MTISNISLLVGLEFGLSLLALTVIVTQNPRPRHSVWLAAFLCCLLAVDAPTFLAATGLPDFQFIWMLSLVALTLLLPILWMFVLVLTHDAPHRMRFLHGVPFALAICVFIGFLALPAEDRAVLDLESGGNSGVFPNLIALGVVVILLLWGGQLVYYSFAILKRLNLYQAWLSNHFANLAGRDLMWIRGLMVLFVVYAIFLVFDLFWSETLGLDTEMAQGLFSVVFIWFLAAFGLRQVPAPGTTADRFDPKEKYGECFKRKHPAWTAAMRP